VYASRSKTGKALVHQVSPRALRPCVRQGKKREGEEKKV